jgi:Flp pilus assembly protein TadG
MINARQRTKRHRTCGQSMVEMALVTPLLVLLILVAVNIGFAMSAYNQIGSMAREGAYYGSLHPTDTAGITSAAIGESGAINGVTPLVSSTVQNDAYFVPNTTTHYQSIRVTVTYGFKPLFTFPPIPSTLTLKRQVEMRVTGS